MSVRIICISKDGGYHENPHEAISSLGWKNESTGESNSSTRLQMYDWIKNEGGKAYVKDSRGNIAYVEPRVNTRGTKYVRTYADQTWTDNLLSLPEC